MTDKEALERAVLLDPAADLPRIVFADWLEEHDPARAEFVRVQCRIAELLAVTERWARTPSDRPGGTRKDGGAAGEALAEAQLLQVREQELLELHWHEWSGRIATYCANFHDDGSFEVRFRRGFIDSIRLPLAAFLAHAGALFAAHPVTAVRITDAVVHPSGGNDTYYLGNLGAFPREYWRRLENHRTRNSVLNALAEVCVAYGRQLAGLPPIKSARTEPITAVARS